MAAGKLRIAGDGEGGKAGGVDEDDEGDVEKLLAR